MKDIVVLVESHVVAAVSGRVVIRAGDSIVIVVAERGWEGGAVLLFCVVDGGWDGVVDEVGSGEGDVERNLKYSLK